VRSGREVEPDDQKEPLALRRSIDAQISRAYFSSSPFA
jgi:hypothetical protein